MKELKLKALELKCRAFNYDSTSEPFVRIEKLNLPNHIEAITKWLMRLFTKIYSLYACYLGFWIAIVSHPFLYRDLLRILPYEETMKGNYLLIAGTLINACALTYALHHLFKFLFVKNKPKSSLKPFKVSGLVLGLSFFTMVVFSPFNFITNNATYIYFTKVMPDSDSPQAQAVISGRSSLSDYAPNKRLVWGSVLGNSQIKLEE
ncbi:hypothetical protein [Agarivorans sp. DSG3-1]|uniref:hypothetical protein n=1 Tax=Agarivorans sp. DSG3-1 TaxID=3342249 RepID=UPI00398F20BF